MEPLQDLEHNLFSRYKENPTRELLSEIVEKYTYITEILSCRFAGKGLEYDDIYQSASIGLMNAVKRFDPSRGTRFSTFATPTVMGEIKRLFRDKSNCIRVPRRLYEIFSRANKIRNEELVKKGKMPSTQELSKALRVSEEQLAHAMYWGDTQDVRSLDQPIDDKDVILSDCIGLDDNEFVMIENKDFISSFLRTLSEKEQQFVHDRFYEDMTQAEIAKRLDTSQMNISRMEKKVLEKLRLFYSHSVEKI